MYRLLLKYMLGLTVLAMIAIACLYLLANRIQQRGSEQVMETLNKGVFYSLQQQLLHSPTASWPAILQKLRPTYGVEISVVPLSAIQMTPGQRRRLLAGEFVVLTGQDTYFAGYGIQAIYTYQRVGDSDYALKLPQDIPVEVVARYASAWMTHLIALALAETPVQARSDVVRHLEQFYGVPLSLLTPDDKSLHGPIAAELKHNDFALSEPEPTSGEIKYIYLSIKNSVAVLRIGPISYPLYVQHQLFVLVGVVE